MRPPSAVSDQSAESSPDAGRRWGDAQRQRERELFTCLQTAVPSSTPWMEIRNDIVVLHLPLVDYCARRFKDRGEPIADVTSVGTIGLIKAVERFDTGRGLEFSTFAMPTIIGEIKRYFRDRSRVIRIPRRLIDLANEAAVVTPRMQRELGREPEVIDIAARIHSTPSEILEARRCTSTQAFQSLDVLLDGVEDVGERVPTQLTHWPVEFEHIEWRCALAPALASLAPRDRQILRLRFDEQLSQAAIAHELGLSQMHVSRLLARSLVHLRECLADAA